MKLYERYLKLVGLRRKMSDDSAMLKSKTRSEPEGEDTQPVQAKDTLAPGEIDWDDDSWLEGDDEDSNEPEE